MEGVQQLLLRHIKSQHAYHAELEEDPERSVPLHHLPDTRIGACLLLLAPHSLKAADLELLTALSQVVPVIPVFAKVPHPLHAQIRATVSACLLPVICWCFCQCNSLLSACPC